MLHLRAGTKAKGAADGRLRVAVLALGLLARAASAGQAPEAVKRLDAWADPDGVLRVRWVTPQPAKCRVEVRGGQQAARLVDEDASCLRGTTNNGADPGIGWASNHRADVEGIRHWPVRVRIVGETREGQSLESQSVPVAAPGKPIGNVRLQRVPITLDAGDWELPLLPIAVGVPFPAGALADASGVRLLIAGQEVPVQARVVTRWRRDHTVKWLRVDFLSPRGTETVDLEFGTAVRGSGDSAIQTPSEPPQPFVPLLPRLVDGEGEVCAGSVGQTDVEESGPVKCVYRSRGRFAAGNGAAACAFTMRTYVWPGANVRRVDFTFESDNTDAELTSFRALELLIPDVGAPGVQVGVDEESVSLAAGERVLQREDFEWVVEPSGATGKRLVGAVRMGGSVAVVLRDFWQQWPVAVERRGDAVVIGLCPALPAEFYAGRQDEDKLYYHVRNGLHTFRQGLTKTWELWFVRGAPKSVIGEKPLGAVPPAWGENSGALRSLAVAVRDEFPGYDEALAKLADGYLADRDKRREYGVLNFGDWYGERTWNWGNLEYDLGHGLLTQFARTGYPAFFRRAEECVRHQRDVDTRHYASDPRRVGQQWTHSMGHTGGYYPPEYKNMKIYASPGWSDNRGHIWAQGLFEHHLLGGDGRSWETARLIADWAAGPQTTNFRFGNAREPGWMTKLVMGAYLATEDPFYLNAAAIMLDATHERSLATGNRGFYYHKLPRGHCNCAEDEKHSGEAGFMLGVLMTGMKMYYDATGEDRVADDIVKTARFIADTMWVPRQLGFRYTPCPHTSASSGSAWILMEGLAFAAARTRDTELADVCRSSLAAAWGRLSGSGKSAGYVLCSSAPALQELANVPGPTFADHRTAVERSLRSPARRHLPTNVPNPDFETDIQGWPSRGWRVERVTNVSHSGSASVRISGREVRQNEYVNTRYDTSGSPFEIAWLKPGRTYRLTAWLRVDRLSAGAPAPSVRLAFRDATGTRGARATNAYDLTRPGTWQQLSADVPVPEWNTRNYIALNTNSRQEIEVEMYLDDIALVPAELASADTYVTYRLDPKDATLDNGGQFALSGLSGEGERLAGPGSAAWRVEVEEPGEFLLWAKVAAGARIASVSVNGETRSGPAEAAEDTWVRLGRVRLGRGPAKVALPRLPEGPKLGRVVLTTDPSSSL